MKLFRRQSQEAAPPVAEEPPQSYPVQGEPIKDYWRSSTFRVVVVAAVVAVAVLAALIVLRSPQTPTTKKVPQKTATSQKSVQAKKTTAPASSSAQPSSSSNTAQSSASAGGQLTNTGPGDVVAWFVATSVVATGLSYFVILRRLDTADTPKI